MCVCVYIKKKGVLNLLLVNTLIYKEDFFSVPYIKVAILCSADLHYIMLVKLYNFEIYQVTEDRMLASPTFIYAKILQSLDYTSGILTNILYEKHKTIVHSNFVQSVPLSMAAVTGFHR